MIESAGKIASARSPAVLKSSTMVSVPPVTSLGQSDDGALKGIHGNPISSSQATLASPMFNSFHDLTGEPVRNHNWWIRWLSLAALVMQAACHTLVLKFAQTRPGTKFLNSTVVVSSELIKLFISIAVCAVNQSRAKPHAAGPGWILSRIYNEAFGVESQWMELTIPGILYLVQSNLLVAGLTTLSPAVHQMTNQLKLLTTALFSVFILKRHLSVIRWISLMILALGVFLAQRSTTRGDAGSDVGGPFTSRAIAGFLQVCLASVISGFAGVYLEKVIKANSTDLWIRNVQLSLFSVVPGFFIGVLWFDGKSYSEGGFFQGYTIWTWAAICLQACGGLLVAVIMKYADNILKNFASSISILITVVCSAYLFGLHVSFLFAFSVAIVAFAIALYATPSASDLSVSSETKPVSLLKESQLTWAMMRISRQGLPFKVMSVGMTGLLGIYMAGAIIGLGGAQSTGNTLFDGRSSSKDVGGQTYAILSGNMIDLFVYWAPFAAEMWRRCDIVPIFLFVEDLRPFNTSWPGREVVSYLSNGGFEFHKVPLAVHDSGQQSALQRIFAGSWTRFAENDRLIMGDLDFLPLGCNYFLNIEKWLKANKDKVYVDRVSDMKAPRFSMCHISATAGTFRSVLDLSVGDDLTSITSNLVTALTPERFQRAFGRLPESEEDKRLLTLIEYDEKYLSRSIARTPGYPNTTSIPELANLIKPGEMINGPSGRNRRYDWRSDFNTTNLFELDDFLYRMISAHVGPGSFELYRGGGALLDPNNDDFSYVKMLLSRAFAGRPDIKSSLVKYHEEFKRGFERLSEERKLGGTT
ncbi:hypothetical protein HDU93_003355 [Gonapodya sp. JEL0774]|nr:hypothetical protein HDU93_003355 [Gonapodya sp. JEL0774]